MLHVMTLEKMSLAEEGRIKAAVDMHLKKLTDDCQDRPGNTTARKLTLEVWLKPEIDPDTGQCDDISLEFEVGSKVPKHRSRPVKCKVRKTSKGPVLLFNDMSENNPDQRTLDEEAPSFRPDHPPAEAI